jgi:DNA-directed RNA polymerase specialized sigma24 family protein
MQHTLFFQLQRDWAALSLDPAANRRLAVWRVEDSALAGLDDLGAVQAAAHDRTDPVGADLVLAALARRAPGDDLAARVLLCLLLPGTKALAKRLWWLDDATERASAAVAAVYERIRTYPIARRPARIAANILADARQQLIRHARPHQLPADRVPLDAELEGSLPPSPARSEPTPAEELLDLLRWAVGAGHLSAEQARLIAASRVADVSCEELGAQVGLCAHSLRRRRQRAERALARAVAARDGSASARRPRPTGLRANVAAA